MLSALRAYYFGEESDESGFPHQPDLSDNMARNSNQGRSGTCVRHALACAIHEYAESAYKPLHRATKLHIKQSGIVNALMQLLTNAKGTTPRVFNNKTIIVEDEQGGWYRASISVKQNHSIGREACNGITTNLPGTSVTKHVVSYDCNQVHAGMNHGRHCVYLPPNSYDLRSRKWIGLNSWGENHSPHPKIPMRPEGTKVYDVAITELVLLPGSHHLDGDDEQRLRPIEAPSQSSTTSPTNLLRMLAMRVAPATDAVVSRSDGQATTLRKRPSSATDSSVWVEGNVKVQNGENISIVVPDRSGFMMVRTSNGIQGYIKSQYVRELRVSRSR